MTQIDPQSDEYMAAFQAVQDNGEVPPEQLATEPPPEPIEVPEPTPPGEGEVPAGETPAAGAPEPPPAEPPPEPPAAVAPDFFEYDTEQGPYRISRDDAYQLALTAQWLQANPAIAERLGQAIRGEEIAPVAVPQRPPEGIDLEDPTTNWMWQQLQQRDAQLAELNQKMSGYDAQLNFQAQANINSLVAQAQDMFRDKFDVTDEQMARIRGMADQWVNVERLIDHDVKGDPTQPNAVQGLYNAFLAAARMDDDFYNRDLTTRLQTQREDTQRKTKAASLSGSSGSTPRQPRPPETETERTKALENDVARVMGFPGFEE